MLKPESLSTDQMSSPLCSLQVILLTYQASELADDIFHAAVSFAQRRPGVQLVVAWGGAPGPRQDRWAREIAQWAAQGADVVLISHPRPLERVRQALGYKRDWVLHLADDDPIAVNYLRVLAEATAAAGPEVSGVMSSNHVRNVDGQTAATRFYGWLQPQIRERLLPMLAQPGMQGTLFWGAYRHAVISEWLAFAESLPFQPSYLDQFLPHMAVCVGKIVVAAEETVLLKDDRNWQDFEAITLSNARYYPDPALSLYHEWFWTADLWRALASQASDRQVAIAVKKWARTMIGHMAQSISARRSILGIDMPPEHEPILTMLRVVGQWMAEPDELQDVAAGLDEVANMACEVRAQWLRAGHVPTLDFDHSTMAAEESAFA